MFVLSLAKEEVVDEVKKKESKSCCKRAKFIDNYY